MLSLPDKLLAQPPRTAVFLRILTASLRIMFKSNLAETHRREFKAYRNVIVKLNTRKRA